MMRSAGQILQKRPDEINHAAARARDNVQVYTVRLSMCAHRSEGDEGRDGHDEEKHGHVARADASHLHRVERLARPDLLQSPAHRILPPCMHACMHFS